MSEARRRRLIREPRMSNLEKFINDAKSAVINRLREDVSKEAEEDFRNTRRLTIEAPAANPTSDNSNIDKQIDDLESLIKRLQDEIVQMSMEHSKLNLQDDDDEDSTTVQNIENIDANESYEDIAKVYLLPSSPDQNKFKEAHIIQNLRDSFVELTKVYSKTIDVEISESESDIKSTKQLQSMITELKDELQEKIESIDRPAGDKPTTTFLDLNDSDNEI